MAITLSIVEDDRKTRNNLMIVFERRKAALNC